MTIGELKAELEYCDDKTKVLIQNKMGHYYEIQYLALIPMRRNWNPKHPEDGDWVSECECCNEDEYYVLIRKEN